MFKTKNTQKKKVKLQVKEVYKIFGEKPEMALKHVLDGTSKTDLLDKYQHTLGLQNISLDICEGEVFVVMGLSGSGKSTLIRHFNRLIEPTAGKILVDDIDVLQLNEKELLDMRRHKMSMVFQRFALLPHKTVLDNVSYGLIVSGVNKKSAIEKAMEQIEMVGLKGYEDQYPTQCSGGMQQRVGLARALATDADILLMDEAFSALDPLIRCEMQDQLLTLQKELHKTIIFITHDMDEAVKIGDRIAILNDGELRQCGTPKEIVSKPADSYIAEFVKKIKL